MEASLHQLRRQASSIMDLDILEEETLTNTTNSTRGRSFRSIRRIRQEKQDQDLLHRTVVDAGRFAYGTKMVEVWVWDALQSKLTRPEGGWWIDPYWQSEDMNVFCQFVDTQRHDYIAPPSLSPGVGVPGVLWSDLGHTRGRHNTHHPHRPTRSGGGVAGSGVLGDAFLAKIWDDHAHHHHDRIAWRDLKALANDPDQPYNKRLEVLASTDLRWTGGVPFSIQGQEGIVIYYARNGIDLHKLQDPTNTTYLMTASDFVGSCWALRIPRQNAVQRRQREVDRNIRQVKYALQFALRHGADLDAIATGRFDGLSKSQKPQHGEITTPVGVVAGQASIISLQERATCTQHTWNVVYRKAQQSASKFKGGGNQLPPPLGWHLSFFTAAGAFISIFAVAAMDDFFVSRAGPDYGVPLGPMAALLALQFGLTAAPAAQPRIILVGQVVSLLTALAFAELQLDFIGIQQSLSCAISIGLMAKLGVVNPPAAANAFVFASGTYGFTNLLMALFLNCLAILCSTLVNNLSDNRQYPTSWGIPQLCLSKEQSWGDQDDTVTALLRRSALLTKSVSFLRNSSNNQKGNSEPPERPPSDPMLTSNVGMELDEHGKNAMVSHHTRKERRNGIAPSFLPPVNPIEEIVPPSPQPAPQADEETGGLIASSSPNGVRFADGTKEPTKAPASPKPSVVPNNAPTSPASPTSPKGRHRRSSATMADMFI